MTLIATRDGLIPFSEMIEIYDNYKKLEKEIAKLRSTYNSHTSYVREEMERSIKLDEKNKQLDKENGELKERLDEAESIIIKINYIGYGLNEFDLIEAYKKKWDRD